MKEKYYATGHGVITYWSNSAGQEGPTLVFLPGLTADHRLFEKQLEYFESRFSCLTWDAPGHGASRPFRLDFSIMDLAQWLHGILRAEGILKPILIGQSFGGYVAQCFAQSYPGELVGFLSIDSAPLQKKYVTQAEIWLLRRMEPVYLAYPWKTLKKEGIRGCAETPYGRMLMETFINSYERTEYCRLAAHGYRILADAMDADLPYELNCPTRLLCGERDRAASTKRYNLRWAQLEGHPLVLIPGAGHNSNTDRPDRVNVEILNFIKSL